MGSLRQWLVVAVRSPSQLRPKVDATDPTIYLRQFEKRSWSVLCCLGSQASHPLASRRNATFLVLNAQAYDLLISRLTVSRSLSIGNGLRRYSSTPSISA